MKNRNIRELVIIFILMFILCGGIYVVLMSRVMGASRDTAMEISDFYLERMNLQIISHFETTVDIKLAQVESIIKTMPPEGELQGAELREAMAVSGVARDFIFLALLSEDGSVELILGENVVVADEEPFLASLMDGYNKIAAAKMKGVEEEIMMLGVPCAYDMENGEKSIAMVAGINVDYVNTTLFMDSQSQDTYSHIIRRNGDFVIKGGSAVLDNYYERLRSVVLDTDECGAEAYVKMVQDTIDNKSFTNFTASTSEGTKYVYVVPLPYSEWYLVTAMSYDALSSIIQSMDRESSWLPLG